MTFSASAENNRVVLTVGPELAATLSLYLSREGLTEEAERTWAAMEEVVSQRWPAEALIATAERRQESASRGEYEKALAAAAVLLGKRLTTEQQRRILRSLVARVDVSVTAGEPQAHAGRGRWAKRAGPKWKLDEIYLRLHRHPAAETNRSDCSRSWVTVRVMRGGVLVAPGVALRQALKEAA